MKIFKIMTTVVVTASLLSGCQMISDWSGKRNNGSLDYQKSKLLAPIKLPAEQKTQGFVHLYPAIEMGKSTIDTTNKTGTQYELPAPRR